MIRINFDQQPVNIVCIFFREPYNMYLNFMSQYNGMHHTIQRKKKKKNQRVSILYVNAIHAMHTVRMYCCCIVIKWRKWVETNKCTSNARIACFATENMRAKVKFVFVSAHYTNTMCAFFVQHIVQIKENNK